MPMPTWPYERVAIAVAPARPGGADKLPPDTRTANDAYRGRRVGGIGRRQHAWGQRKEPAELRAVSSAALRVRLVSASTPARTKAVPPRWASSRSR